MGSLFSGIPSLFLLRPRHYFLLKRCSYVTQLPCLYSYLYQLLIFLLLLLAFSSYSAILAVSILSRFPLPGFHLKLILASILFLLNSRASSFYSQEYIFKLHISHLHSRLLYTIYCTPVTSVIVYQQLHNLTNINTRIYIHLSYETKHLFKYLVTKAFKSTFG